jgi:hypothetical protein
MQNPTPPPQSGQPLQKLVLDQMSPEMQAPFMDLCLAHKLTDDDPLFALILCQAKLLDAFKASVAKGASAAVEGQLTRLMGWGERIRQDRAAADAKQTELLGRHLEEIRRREAKVAEKGSQGWKAAALNYGAIALASLLLGGWLVYFFDAKRVSDADARGEARVKALIAGLPYATRFELFLESRGGRMEGQLGRVVIHPGKTTVKNAYRDAATGDAVIVYQ